MNFVKQALAAGGVGRVLAERFWTPELLGSDLALWLDAADASTITLNGSNVSVWTSKTSEVRTATQATATLQPAYVQNAVNGKSALLLDGVDDYLFLGVGTYSSNSAAIFAVFQPFPSDDVYTLFSSKNADFVRFSDGSTYSLLYRSTRASPSNIGMSNNSISLVGYNVNQPSSIYQLYLNGNLSINVSSEFVFDSLPDRIGGSAGTNRFAGYFCEVVEADTNLSDADRQKLEGYLAWKWSGLL